MTAQAEAHQLTRSHDEANLLFDLTERVEDGLACAEVPCDGDVDLSRVGVLRERAALEEDGRRARGREHDPDVKAPVPVAVTMDEPARLRATEGVAVGRAEI